MPVRRSGSFEPLREMGRVPPVVCEYEAGGAARYLQDRHGYFALNPQALGDIHAKHLQSIVDGEPITHAALIENQKGAVHEGLAFHLAYRGGTKPPVRKGGPSRPIRQGSWADRRGVTADSYRGFVEAEEVPHPGPAGQRLI